MTLKQKTTVTAIALLAVFAATSALALPPGGGQGPGGHVKIQAILTDGDQIEILGQDLDFGPGPLEVTIGGFPVDVATADATSITGTLPDVLAVGDYLLVVSNGNGQSQNDEYDLTITTSTVPVDCPCFDSVWGQVYNDYLNGAIPADVCIQVTNPELGFRALLGVAPDLGVDNDFINGVGCWLGDPFDPIVFIPTTSAQTAACAEALAVAADSQGVTCIEI